MLRISSSEMPLYFYQTTRCRTRENGNRHCNLCEDLKSGISEYSPQRSLCVYDINFNIILCTNIPTLVSSLESLTPISVTSSHFPRAFYTCRPSRLPGVSQTLCLTLSVTRCNFIFFSFTKNVPPAARHLPAYRLWNTIGPILNA
jgi:hypothetical protein